MSACRLIHGVDEFCLSAQGFRDLLRRAVSVENVSDKDSGADGALLQDVGFPGLHGMAVQRKEAVQRIFLQGKLLIGKIDFKAERFDYKPVVFLHLQGFRIKPQACLDGNDGCCAHESAKKHGEEQAVSGKRRFKPAADILWQSVFLLAFPDFFYGFLEIAASRGEAQNQVIALYPGGKMLRDRRFLFSQYNS